MEQLMGCKKKEKRTISSRLTNLRPTKRKASKIWLPSAYSIKDRMPHVYHQHYGNCTSNAVLGCDHFIYHTDAWDPSTTFTYYNQKLREHEKVMKDDGSSIEEALKVVKKYGACKSALWPNDAPFNKKPSKEAYADGLKGKEIKSWYEVKNLKQVKQALVAGHPVAAAFAWAFKFIDAAYVLNTPTKKEADNAPSGHAVVIVGYNDTEKLIEIRNSWSDQWGNNGYGYMTYEAFKLCFWKDDSYAVVK